MHACISVALDLEWFCPPPSPHYICQYLETFLMIASVCWAVTGIEWTDSGMSLNTRQGTGQPSTRTVIRPSASSAEAEKPWKQHKYLHMFLLLLRVTEGTLYISTNMKKQRAFSVRLNVYIKPCWAVNARLKMEKNNNYSVFFWDNTESKVAKKPTRAFFFLPRQIRAAWTKLQK